MLLVICVTFNVGFAGLIPKTENVKGNTRTTTNFHRKFILKNCPQIACSQNQEVGLLDLLSEPKQQRQSPKFNLQETGFAGQIL